MKREHFFLFFLHAGGAVAEKGIFCQTSHISNYLDIGYCEECFNGHRSIDISELLISFSLDIYLEEGLLDQMVFYHYFFKDPPFSFSWWLYQFIFAKTVNRYSLFSTFSLTLVVLCFILFLIITAVLVSVRWYLTVAFFFFSFSFFQSLALFQGLQDHSSPTRN